MSDEALLARLVDVALFVSLAELFWRLWRQPAGEARGPLLAHLGAGLALMVALRLTLAGAGLWPVAACLACSGIAHVVDSGLRRRIAARSCRPGTTFDPKESTST